MSEDYKQGYRDGYRDAMKDLTYKPSMCPITQVGIAGNQCSVCGITGATGFVCHNPQCPTKVASKMDNINYLGKS